LSIWPARDGLFFRKGHGGITVAALLILAAVSVISWEARRSFLSKIAVLWAIPSDPISQADAVVVLGGDGYERRPSTAAELYKRGLALEILVPDDQLSIPQTLQRLGISPQAIATYGNVSSTYEEAHAVAAWAGKNGIKKITVITEIFSGRRVRWIFNRELAKVGVVVNIVVLTPPGYNLESWWRTSEGLVTFRNELIKYWYYRVKYQLFGSNYDNEVSGARCLELFIAGTGHIQPIWPPKV
jgi:uncharacterized SAM-binding protein YcdF (DUF218 family)